MEVEKSIIITHDVNFRGQHIRVSWCKDYDFNRRSPLVSRGVRCNWGAEGKETVEFQGLLHSPSKTESSGKSVQLVGHLRHSHNTCQSRFSVHSWSIWYAGLFRHYGFSVSFMSVSSTVTRQARLEKANMIAYDESSEELSASCGHCDPCGWHGTRRVSDNDYKIMVICQRRLGRSETTQLSDIKPWE